MRIVRFVNAAGELSIGRRIDERHACPLVGELFPVPAFADESTEIVRLLPPVTPPNIFAIGRNYRGHIEETGARTPPAPLVFMKPTTSLAAPGESIRLPASAQFEVDFEAELALVIGRTARGVAPTDAKACIFGYACANDVTARDCQRGDKQWTRGKGFDTFCPLGPWIVTPDDFDPADGGIRSRLNGEIMQNSNTANMMHSCAELVSYLSHQFTLLPGTVILTGTPEGVGFARTPPVFLKAGDVIEIEIDGIGVLRNPVVGPEIASTE